MADRRRVDRWKAERWKAIDEKIGMTIDQLLRWARERLGDDSGMIDAETLLSCVTGESGAALIAGARREVPGRQAGEFQSLVERRARGEPVAYLIGQKEFWSLRLKITPDVLIPRPESELLVEQVVAGASHRAGAAILELGTGSGAIALALASELPHCRIVATDISPAVLEVAKHNRRKLALESVEFCRGDWFEAVAARRFDIIVSNPPYIAPDDRHLRRGDLRFEPHSALVAARNGLADLALITSDAPFYLNAGGLLLLEHGYDQSAAVREMFGQNGFVSVTTYRDLSGHERVTGGQIRVISGG